MKAITAMMILASLGGAERGAAEPLRIESGQAFSLKAGESAQVADGTLRVGFEAVTADSRCPKGAQCVWAGDATARVWLQRGSGPKDVIELRVSTAQEAVALLPDDQLQLMRLDPYPSAGTGLAKLDYVITLMLTRGAPAAPAR